ncbi:MAG: hypothetical protein HW412_2318 [Bacteroidetes bacterium]|nr:hypothetical protein [Bacteroidota bacterium]
MVDNDVVFRKVGNIQRCLKRIRDVTGLNPASFDNLDVQDVFVLNLQRAIQSALDLAAHIVASEGLGLPSNLKENFSLLKNSGIIPGDLSTSMERMVGFRNIAIHEYEEIDVEVLKSILQHHVSDIEAFYTAIVQHFKLAK